MLCLQEAGAAAAASADAGADDYLTKPYTRDQLLRCVGSNLKKQSRR
jgi:DNA-binding response OmpR family regulator